MKILPVSLTLVLCATASAAASDFSLAIGYGTARLKGGQTTGQFLEPKETHGDVLYSHLSLDYAFTDRVGFDTSYFTYSDLTTVHLHDYSQGLPLVVPNNRFRRSVRALSIGPTVTLSRTGPWLVRAGVGWVWSDLKTRLDGGEQGVQNLTSRGRSGYTMSLDATYAFSPRFATGISARYVDFGGRMVSSSRMTALQADVLLALRL